MWNMLIINKLLLQTLSLGLPLGWIISVVFSCPANRWCWAFGAMLLEITRARLWVIETSEVRWSVILCWHPWLFQCMCECVLVWKQRWRDLFISLLLCASPRLWSNFYQCVLSASQMHFSALTFHLLKERQAINLWNSVCPVYYQ